MDFFSHILFGVLTATLAMRPVNFGWVFFAGVMAGLPDFDAILAPLNKIRPSFYFQHRGGSHSYLTAVVVAMGVAALLVPFTGENFFVTWGFGALFYCLHLSLDALTTYRTPLFYPVRKTMYKYGFERAVNPALMFVSLGFDLFLLYTPWTESQFQQVVTGIAVIYFGYLAHRIGLKLLVQRRTGPGSRVFPGTLPLVYYLYRHSITDTTVEYWFIKQVAIFHKKEELYHQQFQAGSPEFTWWQRARENYPEGRFFGTWDCSIPFIDLQNDRVVVTLLNADAYMKVAVISVIIEFERETAQVLNVRQGFKILKPTQKK